MQVILEVGETLDVRFRATDGRILVRFGVDALSVDADLPDSSGRKGEIYREDFSPKGRVKNKV